MPKHSKHRLGCDCLNEVDDDIEGVHPGRCDACTDSYHEALCAYTAYFECAYYAQDGTYEKLTEPCVVLKKDCLFGCTYSSRWSCPGGDVRQDTPWIQRTDCNIVVDGGTGASCTFCTSGCFAALITAISIPDACEDIRETIENGIAESGGFLVNLPFNVGGPRGCEWKGIRGLYGIGNGAPTFQLILSVDEDGNWNLQVVYPTAGCEVVQRIFTTHTLPVYDFNCTSPGTMELTDGEITLTIQWTATTNCQPTSGGVLTNFNACTWAEDPCGGPDSCSQDAEPAEAYDTYYDRSDDCFTKWRLDISAAPSATLTGTMRTGKTAIYVTNQFQCYEHTTFTLQEKDPAFIGIPACLCVRPVNSPFGGCANSGNDACCDSGGQVINVNLTVFNCDNELVFQGFHPFVRGMPLPCGVGNPFPEDPCLYFVAQIPVDAGCAEWGPDLFVVMYCSANTPAEGVPNPCGPGDPGGPFQYNFTVYCFNVAEDCWEEQDSQCHSFECTCLGPNPPELSLTKTCCCEACCPCETEGGKLVEITVACPGGTVTTLSLNSSPNAGECQFNVEDNNGAGCSITGAVTCNPEWNAAISGDTGCGDCIIDTTTDEAWTVTVNSCDPIDVTMTDGTRTVTVVGVPFP